MKLSYAVNETSKNVKQRECWRSGMMVHVVGTES